MDKSIFIEHFSSEEQCREYLYQLRWPNGYKCPDCNYGFAWFTKDEKYKCPACKKKTSLTAGTIFHDSHLPLASWFLAMWIVSSHSAGTKITAKELQEELGFGSNRTALAILEKIKRAMYRPQLNKLSGTVEIATKPINIAGTPLSLVVAVEVFGRKTGCIRSRIIDRNSIEQLTAFIEDCIEIGSEIYDEYGFTNIKHLKEVGYIYKLRLPSYEYRSSNEVAHSIESAIHGSTDINKAAQLADQYCMECNSLKTPISFEELVKNAVKLPPSPKKKTP